jgi:GH15 family glucan-1,4-alpha-glucosidase
MDCAGQHESAGRFYEWVHRVLLGKQGQVQTLLRKKAEGQFIERNEFLNTRYHLNGGDDNAEWGHFQLDGYGTWLWGLVEHAKRTHRPDLLERYRLTVELTVNYLLAFWTYPNFDCWEENPDFIHPSTLACIYGGLLSLGEYENRQELKKAAAEVKEFLLRHCVREGHFVKSIRPAGNGNYEAAHQGVDANLLWLTVPFRVFGTEEELMKQTIAKIESDLYQGGGIHRYAEDTYYGGGAWLILTAWYGWVQAEKGDRQAANACLEWVAGQADELGRMPEQVPAALHSEQAYRQWVKRWGEPALPLLWSHAMFLVLYNSLRSE